MIGHLSIPETEKLLRKEVVGRIGCAEGSSVYVVPISYTYDGTYIYCHTYEGLKVDIMRRQPHVCFEVDRMHDMANWQSVIVNGTFEELNEPLQRSHALKLLHERILPMPSSETTHLSSDWPFLPEEFSQIKGVTFRIKVETKSGRYEKSGTSAVTFFSI
ncbi:MAG TPA: pyridoxamine 5'-phosphate oxidase family protein [Puia sp.]